MRNKTDRIFIDIKANMRIFVIVRSILFDYQCII